MKTALTDFALQRGGYMAFCMSSYCYCPSSWLSAFVDISVVLIGIRFTHSPVHEGTVMDLYPVPVRLILELFVEGQTALFRHTFSFLLVAIPYQNIIAYMGWTFSPEYLHAPVHSLRGDMQWQL